MGRRTRKNKHTAKVGWMEIRNSLRWTLLCLWWVVCLARYLNPLRYLKYKPVTTPKTTTTDGYIFQPSLWERFMDTFRSQATINQKLLDWCQDQLPTFRVIDFGSTWRDGVAFCALLESVCPGSCPRYDLLKSMNRTNNCRLGLKLAYRYLSLPQTLVTAEEMAGGQSGEKVRCLLKHVRWSAAHHSHVSNIDWSRANRPSRAPDGSILNTTEPCLAKGGGLVNGVVAKRCKFNLFVADSTNLNLEIDIRGPNGEVCQERIKRENPDTTNKELSLRTTERHAKNNNNRARSYWLSFAGKSLFDQRANTGRAIVKRTSLAPAEDKKKGIPFDYQCLGDNHLLILYIPCSAGNHYISIKWHGDPIPGSPFTVKVAQNVDTLVTHRSRCYLKDTTKGVALKEDTDVQQDGVSAEGSSDRVTDGSSDTTSRDEPLGSAPVQAAILGHTSTVLRSLSTSSPTMGSAARLTKQATITRKRVLRRIMARAGQEIVIQESPSSSSTEQLPDSGPGSGSLKERMGSPSPKKHTFDFDIVSDSGQSSKDVTPQPDVPHSGPAACSSPLETKPHQQQNPEKAGVGLRSILTNSPTRVGYRRHNSDSVLHLPSFKSSLPTDQSAPNCPIRPVAVKTLSTKSLLSVPMHDENFKSSPFLPASVWANDDLADADMKEKLLEGGFITQMPSGQNKSDRTESDSTMDSDSDGVTFRGTERSRDSDTKASRFSNNMNKFSENSMSHDSMEHEINQRSVCSSNGPFNLQSVVNVEKQPSLAKRPVCKTRSDPLNPARLRKGTPQRSNTSPGRTLGRQRSVDYTTISDLDGPNIKLLQSESLRKSCFYISEKARLKSVGGLYTDGSSQLESLDSIQLENHPIVIHEDKEMGHTGKGKNLWENGEREGVVQLSPKENESSEVDLRETKLKQLFKHSGHRNLTQSLSLPAMSKNWHAFALDSDEDMDSSREEAVSNATRHRPKRASLDSFDLKGQVQYFQQTNASTNGGPVNAFNEEHGGLMTLPEEQSEVNPNTPITQGAFTRTIPTVSNVTSPHEKDEFPSQIVESRHPQIQRGLLHRQHMYQPSSSPDMTAPPTDSKSSNSNEGSDKENETPSKNSLGNKITPSIKHLKLVTRQMDSLKPTFAGPRTSDPQPALRIPRVKVDRTTQVSYHEIKAETGWSYSSVQIQRRRKPINKHSNLSKDSPWRLQSLTQDHELGVTTQANEHVKNTYSDSSLERVPTMRNMLNGSSTPHKPLSDVANGGSLIKPTGVSLRAPQPTRQSTAISGIAAEPVVVLALSKGTWSSGEKWLATPSPEAPVPIVFTPPITPRFISGHRVVTRRKNRRRVVPDPKLFRSSPNTSHDDECGKINPDLQARVSRATGMIKAVCRFNKNKLDLRRWGSPRDDFTTNSDAHKRLRIRSKIGSQRRQVMFSKRVLIHRRSSSKGSSRGSRTSMDSYTRAYVSRDNFLKVESCHTNQRSTSEEATPSPVIESKDKLGAVERWLTQTSQDVIPKSSGEVTPLSQKSDIAKASSEDSIAEEIANNVPTTTGLTALTHTISITEMADLIPDYTTDGMMSTFDPMLLIPPLTCNVQADMNNTASPDRPNSAHSIADSTDDPSYCGFGVSPDVRQGLLEELNAFSNLTSPEYPCSRRTSLKDSWVEQKPLNEMWEADIPTLMEDRIEENMTLHDLVQADEDAKEQNLSEIRELLELALSPQPSPVPTPDTTQTADDFHFTESTSGGTEPSADDVLGHYQAARPEKCTAFGTGLTEGIVGVKNNFQVGTTQAGNGTLTVGVTGPRPHTVTETNVTYTGDDLYDVIYDVTQPGYYIITIRWSDVSIPGSPFVCKVAYGP